MMGTNLRAQEAALSAALHGYVAGVHFDFRHDDIDPDAWSIPPLLSSTPDLHPGFYVAPRERPPEAAEARGRDVLYPGDRVRVVGVTRHILTEDRLEPRPEAEALQLALAVLRLDGRDDPLSPLVLLPPGSLARSAAKLEQEARALLRERLAPLVLAGSEGAAEVEALGQALDARRGAFLDDLADWQATATGARLTGLMALGRLAAPAVALERLIGAAILYGYRHGRLETETAMKPLAARKQAQDDKARASGRKTSDPARVEFAQTYWRERPAATVYEVTKAWCETVGGRDDDPRSVRRTIAPHCPPSSPSWRERAS